MLLPVSYLHLFPSHDHMGGKPVEEANNFQIRYRLPIYTTPPDDDEEVVLDTNGDMTLEEAFKALEDKGGE